MMMYRLVALNITISVSGPTSPGHLIKKLKMLSLLVEQLGPPKVALA